MATPAIAIEECPTTRAGLAVLAGAGGVGVVAALFLPADTWGFGFPLVVLSFMGIGLMLRSHAATRFQRTADWLWIGIALFALFVGWRDAPALRALNLLMMGLFMGTLAIRACFGKISEGSVYDYPFRALGAWCVAFVDAFNLLLNDISWKLLPRNGKGKQLTAVLRGLLLAAPLLIIFGALFVNADAKFEKMLTNSFRFDAAVVFQQIVIGGFFAWMSAGFLRRLYVSQESPAPPVQSAMLTKPDAQEKLGGMELGIVMGSLNLLFLLFVSTQWSYFFGGMDTLKSTGIGVADYARRGFFELVGVAGLALPTLLGLHALIDSKNRRMQKLYKIMASLLVGLLTVVMHSAWLKMQLYMGTFGLTTQRIYVAAILIWLALVFAWFTLTTLNERANKFAWGGVLALAASVIGLNILNPDRFVANWNIQHQAAKDVDWPYLSRLSADAAPVLAKAWDRIPAEGRPSVAASLESADEPKGDWRSWNLSLIQANGVMGKHRDEIVKMAEEYRAPIITE